MSLRASGIAAVFVAFGALLPAAASADDCMCAIGLEEETPWSALAAAIERDRASEADPSETVVLGAIDTAAIDTAAADAAHAAQHRPSSHVLWCYSGDDPRCSPRRHGQEAPSAARLGSAPPAIAFELPPVRSYAGVRVAWTTEVGHARDGVQQRLERPPRG